MNYQNIDACMNTIKKKLNYFHIEFVKEKETRLYFTAIDNKGKKHDIWYNPSSDRYFEKINGCSVLIKDSLPPDKNIKVNTGKKNSIW